MMAVAGPRDDDHGLYFENRSVTTRALGLPKHLGRTDPSREGGGNDRQGDATYDDHGADRADQADGDHRDGYCPEVRRKEVPHESSDADP